MAVMILLIFVALGLALVRAAVNTKTAFTLLMWLVGLMSFFMATNAVSFIGGVALTAVISFTILMLDQAGILA